MASTVRDPCIFPEGLVVLRPGILVLTSAVTYILVLPKITLIMINCQIIAVLVSLAQLFPSWAHSTASASPSGSRSLKSIYFPCLMDVTRCVGRPEVGKIRTDVLWASSTEEPGSARLGAVGTDSLGVDSARYWWDCLFCITRCFISF